MTASILITNHNVCAVFGLFLKLNEDANMFVGVELFDFYVQYCGRSRSTDLAFSYVVIHTGFKLISLFSSGSQPVTYFAIDTVAKNGPVLISISRLRRYTFTREPI